MCDLRRFYSVLMHCILRSEKCLVALNSDRTLIDLHGRFAEAEDQHGPFVNVREAKGRHEY